MSNNQFSGIRLIVLEPKVELLQAFRDWMRTSGFQHAIATSSINELEDRTSADLVDLVICDADVDSARFPEMTKAIRQNEHGPNPYLVTIGVTNRATASSLKQLVDAGLDDIIMKPFSMLTILDRITTLVHSRRKFMASADYIGPDRRLGLRIEKSLPLIDVPNTLRERVHGIYDEHRIRREIAQTNVKVNVQRATQDAVRIYEIMQAILPAYAAGQVNDTIVVHLKHLVRTAQDISRRLEGTEKSHVAGLCDSLVSISENILANHTAPDSRDLLLLRDVSIAIYMAYGDAEQNRDSSNQVVELIQKAKHHSEPVPWVSTLQKAPPTAQKINRS